MLIIKDIRLLPESDYNLCIQAIHRLVMKQYLCPTCHGRGLVYLKFLTKYIDNNKYKRYENYYDYFVSLDNLDNNYEDYLTRLLNKYYNVHSQGEQMALIIIDYNFVEESIDEIMKIKEIQNEAWP